MKSRNVTLLILLCFFGQLSCDPFGELPQSSTKAVGTTTAVGTGFISGVPAPSSIESETFEDIIGDEDIKPAIRVTETIEEITIPTELARFHQASGLDIELPADKQETWNSKVTELEGIINEIKNFQKKKLNRMTILAKQLRNIYKRAKTATAEAMTK